MQNLGNILGDLATEFPDAIEGKNPNSGFDGPPVPSTRQYRAVISRAEWRQAQSSGKYSYSITFEITEPAEYAGKKFTEYYSLDASAGTVGREKFARLIGESGINVKEADTSSEETFAQEFVGKEFVIATRIWGTDMDRNGLRYLNKDRGQKLLDKITPAPSELQAMAAHKLKADIQVNKQPEVEQQQIPETVAEEQAEAREEHQAAGTEVPASTPRLPGGSARPGNVNLPPGLR